MTSFLRSLLEDEDYVYVGENATLTSGESSHSNEGTFDARVFWGVNCFIFVLLTGMCIWCFIFGGKDHLVEWSTRRADTDAIYQQRVRDRHEQRLAARRSTPAKRMARLKRSFQRNKVQMVVKESDIIQADEMSRQHCGEDLNLNTINSQDTDTTQESNPPDVESGVVISNVEALEEGTLSGPNEPAPNQLCQPVNEPNEPAEVAAENAASREDIDAPETDAVAMEEGISAQTPTTGKEEQPAVTTTNETDEPMAENNDAPNLLLPGDISMSSYSEHPTGYLVLRPGDAPNPPPNPKMVPNCCAVCLGAYEPGDTVVWSCNPECSHAFHLDCIMEWLLKIHDGGTPCPCCRQEFTSWEKDRQERKIKWAAGHTFDTAAVSLR